jgi:SRSO17 transposase
MSLLDSPQALALLEDAVVPVDMVTSMGAHLTDFLHRYLPVFYREEQRELAAVVVAGKLSGLQRKTTEPIAVQAGLHRKPLQNFVGAGKWDDEAVMAEMRLHVAEELADPAGVLICDGSGFVKKGTASCGVARQWCGRQGKIDNCQVGVFLGYGGRDGHAPLDRRLYLTQEWAADSVRRRQCHVPEDVVFQEKWRIALDQIARCRELPHAWVTADDEFGRVTAFRQQLRRWGERYVLDVPANTLVRELTADGRPGRFERVDAWARRQPSSRWRKVRLRAGEKEELVVWALTALVQTKDEEGRTGRAERVLVERPVDREGDTTYALSNGPSAVPLSELVRVKGERYRAEQVLQEGKGEVGLAHYEVRSWVGWHHHVTLSLLALWFLSLERKCWGEKGAGVNGAASAAHHDLLARTRPRRGPDRGGDQPRGAAQRRSPYLPLA